MAFKRHTPRAEVWLLGWLLALAIGWVLLLLVPEMFLGEDHCADELARLDAGIPGSTDPAANEAVFAAAGCLLRADQDAEAIALLESRISESSRDCPGRLVLLLGVAHRKVEDRRRAEHYLQYLLQLECAGEELVRRAQLELDALDEYVLGPYHDRLLYRVQRFLDIGGLPGEMAVPATMIAGKLTIALALAGVVVAVGAVIRQGRGTTWLASHWSLAIVMASLVAFWTAGAVSGWLSSEVADLALQGDWPAWVVAVTRSCGQWFAALLLLTIVIRREGLRIFQLPSACRRSAIVWSLICLTMYALLVALVDVLHVLMTDEKAIRVRVTEANSPALAILGLHVTTLAIVAAGEESIYRVAAYAAFSQHVGRVAGGVASAVLFGAIHPGTLAVFAKAAIFGVLAVWLVEKFRSVLPAIVVHWLVNVASYLGVY